MPKSIIIYQADQEVIGKHLRSKEWIMYSGKLTIYNRKTNPIVLKLKSEIMIHSLGSSWMIIKSLKVVLSQLYLANYQNGTIIMG